MIIFLLLLSLSATKLNLRLSRLVRRSGAGIAQAGPEGVVQVGNGPGHSVHEASASLCQLCVQHGSISGDVSKEKVPYTSPLRNSIEIDSCLRVRCQRNRRCPRRIRWGIVPRSLGRVHSAFGRGLGRRVVGFGFGRGNFGTGNTVSFVVPKKKRGHDESGAKKKNGKLHRAL